MASGKANTDHLFLQVAAELAAKQQLKEKKKSKGKKEKNPAKDHKEKKKVKKGKANGKGAKADLMVRSDYRNIWTLKKSIEALRGSVSGLSACKGIR